MTFLPRLLLILALALGTLAPVEWRPGWIPGSGPAAAQRKTVLTGPLGLYCFLLYIS